jgi:hypothetical protein
MIDEKRAEEEAKIIYQLETELLRAMDKQDSILCLVAIVGVFCQVAFFSGMNKRDMQKFFLEGVDHWDKDYTDIYNKFKQEKVNGN